MNDALEVARKMGVLPWLGPDTKTQVIVEYQLVDGALIPIRIDRGGTLQKP
jgi:S-adenosylmethionine synthetase